MLSSVHLIVAKLAASSKPSVSLCLAALAFWVAAAQVEALELSFQPDLKQAGWKVHTPSGKASASFTVEADGSLSVAAPQAVAFLYRFVPDEGKAATTLSWHWRVTRDFAGTDLSEPGDDDRPIAVHVYFTDQKAGLLKRFGRGLAGMFGVPVSGQAITYVWGGQQPVGTMMPNPFMKEGDGVLVIRRASMVASPEASPAPEWQRETVDLAADYRSAFGEDPPPISVVAVSADTDDTGAESLAHIRALLLEVVHPPLAPINPAR